MWINWCTLINALKKRNDQQYSSFFYDLHLIFYLIYSKHLVFVHLICFNLLNSDWEITQPLTNGSYWIT